MYYAHAGMEKRIEMDHANQCWTLVLTCNRGVPPTGGSKEVPEHLRVQSQDCSFLIPAVAKSRSPRTVVPALHNFHWRTPVGFAVPYLVDAVFNLCSSTTFQTL